VTTRVAVVGLACRFPGAPDAEAFWALLRDGREGLTRLDDAELARRGVPAALRRHPDYVPVGGLIDGQDRFDPDPFGLTDAEAALLDPQQRLFLECAWQALERAGHGGGRGAGAVGVFAGAAESAYLASNLAGRWDPTGGGRDPVASMQTAMATQVDYLPLQVAYRLDLTGPAVAVTATCATSLVAVHQAVQSLVAGECDTALAGGASLIVPQGLGYLHVPDGIFSADGRMRAFSAHGTGIVYTQGVGAVVLRRLDDALADGDPVLAVVHGSAVGNDGADKAGFTAPSVRGQARVVAEALEVAGVAPRDVGLVEAHGSATRLGDPIETAALRRVFGDTGPAWCGLGSVKSTIGHANAAAGIASFLKAVLAVAHRTLPATLHALPLNPDLGLEGSPFRVVTATRPWDSPPHAGVSAFGIGGTNAHVVLGPAPDRPVPAPDPRPQLLVVSGHTPAAARATAAAVAAAVPDHDPADLAHTLAAGRVALGHRVAAVATGGEAPAALTAAVPVAATTPAPRVVLAFPGAGSQYGGMGAELYRQEPVFAEAVDACADLLSPLLGADVRDVFTLPAGAAAVRDPAFGLPALFAVSLATGRLLGSWGVRAGAVLGHSLGEYTAAAFAGALDLADAARLVAVRCAAAARAAGGGLMLAVPLGEAEVAALLAEHPDVDLAVVNAPSARVLSGPAAAVRAVAGRLRARGLEPVELAVDAGLHSRLVDPALPAMRAAAAGLTARPATVPVVSTVTGGAPADLADPEHWVRQLRDPVRFADALRVALGDGPVVVVQVGPGVELAGLARWGAARGLRAALPTLVAGEPGGDPAAVREAAGALWAHGADVDLGALSRPGRRRVVAPGLAFQRRRLWIDPPPPAATGPIGSAEEPFAVPVWQQVPPVDAAARLDGPVLLAAAPGPWADAVADALRAAGADPAPLLDRSASADDPADGEGRVDVAAVPPRAGKVGGAHENGARAVVVLAGEGRDVAAVAEEVRAQARVAAALARLGTPPPPLLLVTREAERVGGDESGDLAGAAARVLPRVVAQETPGLRWRTLDAGRDAPPAAVVAELADLLAVEGSGEEVARRGRLRWRRTLVPWRPADPPAESGPAAAAGPGAVLVTGGLGDVGLLLGGHLAARGRRVVLTSRGGAPPAGSDRAAALDDLAARGLPIEVRRCDAGDPAATAALLAELAADGPLDLVVHAAGVVAGAAIGPLRDAGPADVDAHLHAKLGGALALAEGIAALPAPARPRAVVLMSSATTLVGGIGMGPYAASNGALDALAPAHEGWVSAIWDGWRVGPRGGERTVVLAEALDAATGTRALDRLVAAARRGAAPGAVAVSTGDLGARMAAAAAAPAAAREAAADDLAPVEREVAALWSRLLGAPVTAADADFFALGGHSLLATRMLADLRERAGVDLRLRDLLAAPTVGALAARVAAAAAPAPAGGPGAHAPSAPGAVVPAGGGEPGDPTFPLTRVQHAYWVGRQGGYRWGDVPCHFSMELDSADLDLDRYERAWNRVIDRHPMLRATITPQGRVLVRDDLPRYRIRVHDLTGADPERVERRLAALRDRVAHQPGPPDRWPLFQVQAARLPGGRVRLFLGVDALICDAGSWWILDRELHTFYEHPDADLPLPGVGPAACVAALAARRDGPAGERAAAYWRGRLDTLPGPPSLPVREPAGRPRFTRRATRLDRPAWDGLRAEAARRRLTPAAVLLTAYADTLADWSGDDRFAVTLTLFDRPPVHPDVDGVVGDFTSLVLHEVDRVPAAPFAVRAAAVQERLFADLDHREVDALEVLAELAARTGAVRSVPVVFTSALGMDDVLGGTPPDWAGEQVAALSQTPQTWLDHQVLAAGGELRLQWDAPDEVLPADQLDRAVAAHHARVARLATDPTAWDLPATPPSGGAGGGAGRGAGVGLDVALPIRAGRPGGPVLFLAHPSGGDVLCYAELARRLHEAVTVVGLTDPALAVPGADAPGDIPGLAAAYVAAVRDVQPRGPYLLGGWSMGGTVAQEMARRLHADGEHVALLAMLDANDPAHIRPLPGADDDEVDAELAVRYLRALEAFLGVDLGAGDDGARTALLALSPADRRAEVERRLAPHRLLGRGEAAGPRLAVLARHLRALAEHRAGRLEDPRTHTLLVRADRPSPRNSGVGMGVDDTPPGLADLGWGAHLAGPLEVVAVDAHHYALLHGAALPRVADAVGAALHTAVPTLAQEVS